MRKKLIRILIVDGHKIFSQTLKSLLTDNSLFNVIGIAENHREAKEYISVHKPDVVLLDINLSKQNGTDFCTKIKHNYPSVKVIIISMYNDKYNIVSAYENNADGYVPKESIFKEIAQAIVTTMENGRYFSDSILNQSVSSHSIL